MRKVVRLLVAATVAFAPSLSSAFASSGMGRVNAQVLSLEEMQSEFGAGGGGGGGTPTPPSNPDYPSCQYNFDGDGYCDNYTFDVSGIIRDNFGPAYKRITETAYWYCQPGRADASGRCNVSASFVNGQSRTFTVQFELSAPLGRGDLINASVGAGYETSYTSEAGVSGDTTIPVGYAIRAAFEAQGKYWSGRYNVRWTDSGDGPRSFNITYAFPVTSGYGPLPGYTWRKTTYNRIIGFWDGAIRY